MIGVKQQTIRILLSCPHLLSEFCSPLDKVDMASNDPYLVSPTHSSDSLPSPLVYPGSSVMIKGHLEGPLTERQARHGQCTYIFAQ